ncbi:50S ribosomal protein L13 [Patescibacteria group bacterium]|nr:50S ribosomal protein L13 [Patescibacteria group bacterium]
MKRRKTPLADSNKEYTRAWLEVDASKETFGRVVSLVATHLIGKKKVQYTPHQDFGDNVVVTNVDKLKVTGNKRTDKKYYSHSWYPGSIKEKSFEEKASKDPVSLFKKSVEMMLPKNKLANERLKRLKVVEGTDHPYKEHFSHN